ncbi:helix-turn-helix transcriptional regulator [Pararhizobium sp. IMCC21322]|uniref:ArsR/SmtB family transcription factor n=1 Tax=Pararhizobium sp. IMCC21322 TaxID=3067903 RepID=UPI0027408DD4|nr:metalloregulator ArsR/SmtB family transcription factor [Pararhizobium sp. IMCC21322]
MKNNNALKPAENEGYQSDTAHLDRVFHALSDPTRRAIVQRLSGSSGTVSMLAEPFDMSLNAVSKHLKVLEGAKLINRDIVGRTSVCSLNIDPLINANEWIQQYTQFWNEVLDSLEMHLDADEAEPGAPAKKDEQS